MQFGYNSLHCSIRCTIFSIALDFSAIIHYKMALLLHFEKYNIFNMCYLISTLIQKVDSCLEEYIVTIWVDQAVLSLV